MSNKMACILLDTDSVMTCQGCISIKQRLKINGSIGISTETVKESQSDAFNQSDELLRSQSIRRALVNQSDALLVFNRAFKRSNKLNQCDALLTVFN
mmetsp:Transcript_15397/g.35270  ORF Transcript_15397/g.35270 Transcript_15397/m.35270 type:complete len:97 (+) Transcript_15397:3-293(+)